eukprot:gene30892-40205_t
MYKLVNAIHAHEGPIRSIAVSKVSRADGIIHYEIVTGCQSDSPNAKKWALDCNDEILSVGSPLYHDHWVTALTSLSADGSRIVYPEGCFITGCMDSKIRVFDNISATLQSTLVGHSKGVISFSWTTSFMLISGSWDGSAKVWDLTSNACISTLNGHENGVHVLGLTDSTIATTSTGEAVNGKPANFRLRFWNASTGTLLGDPIEDHSGPLRSIAAVSGIGGLVTTSNDGTAVLRSIDGQQIGVLPHPAQEDGSPPFVLDCCEVCAASGMDTVSCAEDGSVMAWSGTDGLQYIPHPNTVWCVVGIPDTNGDFLTAGHDGVLRHFSRDPVKTARASTSQLTEQLAQEVQEAAIKRKRGPSSEELAKATKWEDRGLRQYAGKSENQVMVFNKDGKMIAAQWMSGSWVEVGEVTGSSDGGYVGSEFFDHVLPVEMDTPGGLRTLNLGYNNGENPFVAAQRFINQNEIGQNYLQQIADWIIARSGQQTPVLGVQPSQSSAPPSLPTGYGTSAKAPAAPSWQFSFKATAYLLFDDFPSKDKLLAKVVELNADNTVDSDSISNLLQVLSDSSHYHVSTVEAGQVTAALRMMQWNRASQFPLFDILRMAALHPQGAAVLAQDPLRSSWQPSLLALFGEPDVPYSTLLTATRFLSNAFRHDPLRSALFNAPSDLCTVLRSLSTPATHSNKLVRLATATVVLNAAVLLSGAAVGGSPDLAKAFFELAVEMISREMDQSEVIFRSLKAIGTAASVSMFLTVAKSDGIPGKLAAARANTGTSHLWGSNLSQCFEEVIVVLS